MCLKILFILCFSKFLIVTADEIYSYVGCYRDNISLRSSIRYGNVHDCTLNCEKTFFRYAVLSPDDSCSCVNELISMKLDDQLCNYPCSKSRSQYCGGPDAQSYYTTGLSAALAVLNLNIINRTDKSLELQWDKLSKGNRVTNFVVKASVLKTFASYPIINQREWTVQKDDNRFELSNLHPGTLYNITVEAFCKEISCGTVNIEGETNIGVPDPPPKEPRIVNRTDTTLTVELLPGINNNGPITYYRIVVQIIDDVLQQDFDEKLLVNYNQSLIDGVPYYITGEINFMNYSHDFHVGDGFTYRKFYNAPLPPKAHIHILLGIISMRNGITTSVYAKTGHDQHNPLGMIFYDQEAGEQQPSILVLTIACVIFGILLVLSVITYIILRYKTAHRRQRLSDTHELTMQGPMVEVENGAFTPDEFSKGDFKTQLNFLIDNLDNSQRFARNTIRLNVDNVIANGKYGEVLTGKTNRNNEPYDCQVHVISDDMEPQDKGNFLKEFSNITQLMPNEKFVNFLGVSASPDWFYVLFEIYPISLKKKLVESRIPQTNNNERFSTLSEECIVEWIYDLAVAMEYLEVNKICHKQLCSHNIYVTSTNHIKVSLFGATPFVDYTKKLDLSRWLAPEVLRFQLNSPKGDVWSFGCVAWECCTLGATPYPNIMSSDLLTQIKNGCRPEQPIFVYNDLYQLFLNCWQLESNERPDFEDIAFNVRQILTSPRHSISFDRKNNMVIPYYLPLLELQA